MGQLGFVNRSQMLLAVLAHILVMAGCTRIENTALAPTHSSDLSVPSVKDLWSQALSMAGEWHSDAYVTGVSVYISSWGSSETSFSFQSPSDADATFDVTCDTAGCSSSVLQMKPAYPPMMECIPVALDDFALDSRDAFNIGLQQGGEEYMQASALYILLMLSRPVPYCKGPMTWSVSFIDLTTAEGIQVRIDAATGEVIEVVN